MLLADPETSHTHKRPFSSVNKPITIHERSEIWPSQSHPLMDGLSRNNGMVRSSHTLEKSFADALSALNEKSDDFSRGVTVRSLSNKLHDSYMFMLKLPKERQLPEPINWKEKADYHDRLRAVKGNYVQEQIFAFAQNIVEARYLTNLHLEAFIHPHAEIGAYI